MAGQPIKRELIRKIDKLGGFNAIMARVADGETLKDIAVTLGVSRGLLSSVMNASPEHQRALIVARAQGALLLQELKARADARRDGKAVPLASQLASLYPAQTLSPEQ